MQKPGSHKFDCRYSGTRVGVDLGTLAVVRVGIVSYWFNRGQATVSRHLREIIDRAGHESFVFARPTNTSFEVQANNAQPKDVWNQESVTVGEAYRPFRGEYLAWVKANELDLVFFDQNYEFDEIRSIRNLGVKTIGRFVWESFASEHVEGALGAFSTIYSLTFAEQERYHQMGIDSPYISWGCHPELLAGCEGYHHEGPLIFLGGWMSARKPLGSVLEAYRLADGSNTPLVVKSQRPLRRSDLLIPESMDQVRAARRPPHEKLPHQYVQEKYGVLEIDDDVAVDDYLRLLSGARALMCPSRWEGLGLHFFEAMALGIPVISSDMEPIRDFVSEGVNGILVDGKLIGHRKNGIPAYEPSTDHLAKAIKSFESSEFANQMASNMRDAAEKRSWSLTEQGILALL